MIFQIDMVRNQISRGRIVTVNHYNEQRRALLSILSLVWQIVERLYKKNEEDNLRKKWQRATDRLDILLMIVFFLINCVVTFALLIFGYSNLQL